MVDTLNVIDQRMYEKRFGITAVNSALLDPEKKMLKTVKNILFQVESQIRGVDGSWMT